ncbi:MAG: hypothetical protein J5771_05780 [Bacteroidales bacterium]|nr:hypothetical protein [Bacteroidales bacterium]
MLERLRDGIQKLISLYETEKNRANALELELQENKVAVQTLKEQIAELNRQIDNQRLASAFSGTADNREAKDRLTKLIKEIDRCIALLEA